MRGISILLNPCKKRSQTLEMEDSAAENYLPRPTFKMSHFGHRLYDLWGNFDAAEVLKLVVTLCYLMLLCVTLSYPLLCIVTLR